MIPERLPLADVKNRLSEVVDGIEREHGRVVITKHGRPAAVLLNAEDLESLEETLSVLSRSELLAEVREALVEEHAGAAQRLAKNEALALINRT